MDDPICVITKYCQDNPENKGIFSPTITLHITPKTETGYFENKSLEDLMEISEFETKMLLNKHEVAKRYQPNYISGNKFFEYDAEYLFEHTDILQPVKAELKVLKTEHNGFYYDFNCHQSKSEK